MKSLRCKFLILPFAIAVASSIFAQTNSTAARAIRLRITDNFTQLPVANAQTTLEENYLGIDGSRTSARVFQRGAITIPLTNAAASYQFQIVAEGYGDHRSERFGVTNA